MERAWQRRRSPEDVPTPVAVAVSDFCRRAGQAASPAEVRDALSLLGAEEDFRVRGLTDAEPAARSLGPYAVVDILQGTAPELAAARQACGYYELAQALVSERERPAPPAAAPIAPSPTGQPQDSFASPLPAAEPAGGKERRPRKLSMEERIAPKKRAPSPQLPSEPLPALEPARPRDAAAPKGRYSQLSPTRRTVEELFGPEGREVLTPAVEQHPDRFALTRALATQYEGRKEGQPLRTEDLERALAHHELLEKLQRKERDAVLCAYADQRGASRRTANALGLSMPELNRLTDTLGLKAQIEEVREHCRREALSPNRLGVRLDLLGREKYLQDLGIRRKFDESLRADLHQLLRAAAPKAHGRRELILAAAKREGAPAELLWRAVEKLGLSSEVKALFPDDPDSEYAP